jgi:hypothetical protein
MYQRYNATIIQEDNPKALRIVDLALKVGCCIVLRRWPMADGRWPMADGRWLMADG